MKHKNSGCLNYTINPSYILRANLVNPQLKLLDETIERISTAWIDMPISRSEVLLYYRTEP